MGNLKGFIIEDGVLTKYKGTDATVVIPDGVTHIGNSAFENSKNLTELVMPDSVISIGRNAFEKCIKLKTVTVSKKLEVIGNNAFCDCKALKNIALPSTMREIEYAAFAGCVKLSEITCNSETLEITSNPFKSIFGSECKLLFDENGFLIFNNTLIEYNKNDETIVVPDGVTHIYGEALRSGVYTWEKKLDVKKIVLPDSVKHIGRFAFSNNDKLEEIIIPDGIEIEAHAFDGCVKLSDENGLIIFGNTAYAYVGKDTEITIPANVEFLAEEIFCPGLISNPVYDKITKVILPHGLKRIGKNAFSGCTSLCEINIPESVGEIEEGAFYDCVNIKNITVPSSTVVRDMAFSNCRALADENGLMIINNFLYHCLNNDSEVVVPEHVEAISTNAFNMLNVEKVILPKKLKYLGAAFKNCKRLKEIDIPEGITSIADVTFQNCEALEKLKIPESVTQIGMYAFQNCKALKEITIPGTVKIISSYMFENCTSLENITLSDGVEVICYQAFSDCSALKQILLPESVEKIESCAFENCTRLKRLEIKNKNCKRIDPDAFHNCPNLVDENGFKIIAGVLLEYAGEGGTVVIPDNVTKIAPNAFREGSDHSSGRWKSYRKEGSLNEVVIPAGVKTIDEAAFMNCRKLSKVTLAEGVEFIGSCAFSECKALSEIKLPSTVKSLSTKAFLGCEALARVTIPKKTEAIGLDAFRYCEKLTDIFVEAGNAQYSDIDGILYNAEKTTLIYSPAGKKLKEFTVSDNVTSIDDHAFIDCEALKRVVIPESVKKIGNEVFARDEGYSNVKLKDIRIAIGAGSESVGEHVIEFPYGDGPLVYPEIPVLFPKEQTIQVRLCLGFCQEAEKYNGEYAEAYRKYAQSHQKTLLKKAALLELKAVEEYFAPKSADNADPVYKPDLTLKKPNELRKVEILEEAVIKGTLEDLRAVLETYKTFELTARALGLAARYRGVDFVRELTEHGATFKYKLDATLQRKYNISQKTVSGHYKTEYYLMLVPEKLALEYTQGFITSDYDYTPMCGVSYIQNLKELEVNVLPLEERIEIVRFFMDKKPSEVSFDEMLFWAITRCELHFADALIEMGVNLNQKAPTYYNTYMTQPYIEIISGGNPSVYWTAYVSTLISLEEKQLLPVLERLEKLAASVGKKLILTQKMFDDLKWNDDSLTFALKKFDVSKINQGKAIERIISENGISTMEVVADLGWLSRMAKLDKAMKYAQSNKNQEIIAWIIDYRNRNFDIAAEAEKAESRMLKELAEDPNSVSALKKIWSYKKLDDGSLIITSYKGSETNIEVPAMIGKSPVTVIGKNTFAAFEGRNIKNNAERKKIVSVVIPEGVTTLEDSLFWYCEELEKIVLPTSLKKIGTPLAGDCKKLIEVNIPKGAAIDEKYPLFIRCNALHDEHGCFITDDGRLICHTENNGYSYNFGIKKPVDNISVPDGVKVVGVNVFNNGRMVSVNIPDSVEKIEKKAFFKCDFLEELNIPGNVKVIGAEAFSQCCSLKNVRLACGVTKLGRGAFALCSNLREVYVPDSVEEINEKLFGPYDSEAGDVYVYGICVHTKEGAPIVEYLKKYSNISVKFDYDE